MTVHAERRGDVALLTIDRPERRNAVDHVTLDAISTGIDAAVADGMRGIVLTGAGGNFCAGADLTGVEDEGFAGALRGVLQRLSNVPITTIAAVDGFALGGGTQLASFCDLRVATPGATFGIPAAKLGLMVDTATVQRVLSLAGGGTARAMLLAGSTIDGQRAFDVGMVQRLGGLDDALAWANEIAALAPLTIAGHKLTLEHPDDTAAVAAAFSKAWSSNDVKEGRAAFVERRPPRFTGS